MKTLASILAVLALMLLAAPAGAQQDMVNLHFRLTVQGAPCPNATYWGFFGAPNSDDVNYVQLSDPEGDGVYTGTGTHTAGRLVAQIIQGTGSQRIQSILLGTEMVVPGEPSQVIRNFGVEHPDMPGIVPHLVINQDMTFQASVQGCPVGLPDTGVSDMLPLVPLFSAGLLLATGIYIQRRTWRQA
jgi:hypothetical protein